MEIINVNSLLLSYFKEVPPSPKMCLYKKVETSIVISCVDFKIIDTIPLVLILRY